MMSDVRIWQAAAHDIELIMPVMASAFDPTYGEAWSAAQCAGMLSLPKCWLLLANLGNKTVGFALVRAVLDEAEVLLVAVRPDFQKLGIGKQLITQAISDSQKMNVRKLHLEVRDSNPARRFYANIGFETAGIRKNYYRGIAGQSSDAVTLCLTLSL
jgi:[ribosomal protein S18]-alanine N-acetyltransferase